MRPESGVDFGPRTALCALGSLLLVSAASCRRAEPTPEKAAPSVSPAAQASARTRHHEGGFWFEGTPEQAFAEAKAKGKLVFFYWGAAWCPPCNRLKAEVFSKPRFAELMRGFVPVYLDGDEEAAQSWGETLGAQAYPTILILTPQKDELFRLTSSVDMAELEEALQGVLQGSQAFGAAVEHLEAGAPAPGEWRLLAYADWGQLPDTKWEMGRRLRLLRRAWETCPAELRAERSLFAMNLVSLAVESEGVASLAGALGELKEKRSSIFDSMLDDADARWAARIFLTTWTKPSVGWLFDKDRGEAYQAFKKRWLEAAAAIGRREGATAEIRLLSAAPALDFHKLESPDGPAPEALRAEIERAVREAEEQAKGEVERHAVASHASVFLQRIGEVDRARAMLLKEVERSETPWYYQSSLSSLEQQVGNEKAAKEWSAKARQSARGSASRIQWIVNDVALNAKAEDAPSRAYLLGIVAEYYELATGIRDGFVGRNATRAEQVAAAIEPIRKSPELVAMFKRYRARCDKLEGESRSACRAHFDRMEKDN
jgi:protein disulfide-isomerase